MYIKRVVILLLEVIKEVWNDTDGWQGVFFLGTAPLAGFMLSAKPRIVWV